MVEEPWPVLGIARTTELRSIKKAYTARLKHVHPEDDAEGFQRLREAYEAALALARWETVHRDAAAEAASAGPLVPGWPAVPWHTPVAPTADASSLVEAVTRLDADPQRRALEEAWRELLASEPLWNLDTRSAFETELIERILARTLVLAPPAWALLQLEFHWNAEALAARGTLAPWAVELLLDRRNEAPVDFAARLCDEGRYDEVRALLGEIARGRSRLARQAWRLLARCDAEEAADAAMGGVRALQADGRAWSDVNAWRSLLERTPLRRAETRQAFQRKLLALLAEQEQGSSGPVWRLLEDRFHWSREATAADLARAAGALGRAIVEAVEGASPALRDGEVIERLSPFVEHMEGEARERGRRLLEASCQRALERAERLERLERRREAIEEAALVASAAAGDVAARARELVERTGRAILAEARRLHERKRFGAAVDGLAPVVVHLSSALGTQARLLLAQCHRAGGAYARAEEPLDEVLRVDPLNREALLLMAAVKEESGQREGAAAAWTRVLRVDPENGEAGRRLERLQAEQAAVASAEQAHESSSSGAPFWPLWLVLWMALSRQCGVGGDMGDLLEKANLAKVVGVTVAVVVLAVLVFLAADAFRDRRPRLDLAEGGADLRSRSRQRWTLAAAVLAAGALAIALLCVNSPSPTPPPDAGRGKASAPAAVGEPHAYGRPRDVQILELGPEELPLHQGRMVRLSARVSYDLSGGGGVVKLFAAARPRGESVEIDAQAVREPSGTVLLFGPYQIPSDATRIDITASLHAGYANDTQRLARAFLAVEP